MLPCTQDMIKAQSSCRGTCTSDVTGVLQPQLVVGRLYVYVLMAREARWRNCTLYKALYGCIAVLSSHVRTFRQAFEVVLLPAQYAQQARACRLGFAEAHGRQP